MAFKLKYLRREEGHEETNVVVPKYGEFNPKLYIGRQESYFSFTHLCAIGKFSMKSIFKSWFL